jgi:hypothetical protein
MTLARGSGTVNLVAWLTGREIRRTAMTVDLYTKAMLTIIAGALVTIAARGSFEAQAQFGNEPCGSKINPCHIATWNVPIGVKVDR